MDDQIRQVRRLVVVVVPATKGQEERDKKQLRFQGATRMVLRMCTEKTYAIATTARF